MKRRAVVLLSGGLYSATTLVIAGHQGFSPHTLSFDYGQRHRCELGAARRVAQLLGSVEHKLVRIGVNALDYSGYPDCRPEYLKAFRVMADLAPKAAPAGAATPAGCAATVFGLPDWSIP